MLDQRDMIHLTHERDFKRLLQVLVTWRFVCYCLKLGMAHSGQIVCNDLKMNSRGKKKKENVIKEIKKKEKEICSSSGWSHWAHLCEQKRPKSPHGV